MPIYEYECGTCTKVFEVIQKFSDAPLEKCPTCGGPVNKVISLSSFHLKGGGWYKTDYAKSSPSAKPASNEPKPAEKSEAKTETKTESKPASTDSKKAGGD